MNIQEIQTLLNAALEKLELNDIDDDAKLDLEILALQLKKQIIFGAFDVLKDISTITVADVSQLTSLVGQVDAEIENEIKRNFLISKITSIAKVALKASGVTILS